MHLHRPTLLVAGIAVLATLPAAPAHAARDRDRDGLPDRWERKHKARSAKADHDRDGLSNRAEYKSKTDPRRRDSDRDGRWDGSEDRDRDKLTNAVEVATANDPARKDSDADGVLDTSEGAGRVVAVDGTTVTIALAAGGTVTGRAEPGTLLCQPAWEWEGPIDILSDEFEEAAQREAAAEELVEDGEETDEEVARADAEDGDAGHGIRFAAASLQSPTPPPGWDPSQGSIPNPNDGNPVLGDDELERIEDVEYERIGHEDDPDWRETTDACAPGRLVPGAWVHEVTVSRSDEAGVEFEELLIVE